MDQYLNSQRTALLWDLLANPADKDASHTQNLQDLVDEYPQSGLLQALLTYVSDNPNLQRAAVYVNPKVLYKLNKDIEELQAVSAGQLLSAKEVQPMAGYFHVGEISQETAGPVNDLPTLVPDAGYEAALHPESAALSTDANALLIQPAQETDAAVTDPTDKPADEESTTPVETQQLASAEPEPKPSIEEDTYDEIVSIDDINLAVQEYYATVMEPQSGAYEPSQFSDIYAEALKTDYEPTPIVEANFFPADEKPAAPPAPANPPAEQAAAIPEPVAEAREETVFKDRKVDLNDEAEKLILNNIAATDFFVFDRAFGERKKEEEPKIEEPQPAPAEAQQAAPSAEPAPAETEKGSSPEPLEAKSNPYENISKYHDEKMPYSFMWWLDKTRREHSGIYQPFVEFKLDNTRSIKPAEPTETIEPVEAPDELQQQYMESIFQLNTVEELEGIEQEPVHFDPKKKEDEIIERFIQEVPQIRPQTPDKLDNENKARKSSEDEDELVTETLAQIYIDQMLYPKAIATYKKLMLKFPEKSLYFAGQIDALQKK